MMSEQTNNAAHCHSSNSHFLSRKCSSLSDTSQKQTCS